MRFPLLAALALLALGLATSVAPVFAQAPAAPTPAIPDPVKAGQEIAARLRKAGPEKSSSFDGWMTITRPDRTNTLPIRSRIQVGATNWHVRYTAGTNPVVEALTIVHPPGQPNLHYTSTPTNATVETSVSGAELFRPFAGSDFWRIDLGLDFLSWPQQRQIAHQMRRGRACRVLESRNPNPAPGTYSRVVSWVDVESDGILKAEAYDVQNTLMKEFLVGSFRKVDGQYELEEMTIRLPHPKQETQIRFDLEKRPGAVGGFPPNP